ncbi:hypothetical protein ALP94_02259 [Pseudomonas savastanoi pv. glycinea]|nr:hypothetical protein ALP94_02259 [Pseudomonas savastanoi pv. glycinea]
MFHLAVVGANLFARGLYIRRFCIAWHAVIPNEFGHTEVRAWTLEANLFAKGFVHPQVLYRLTHSFPE